MGNLSTNSSSHTSNSPLSKSQRASTTSSDTVFEIRTDQLPLISSSIMEAATKQLLSLPSGSNKQIPDSLSGLISPQHLSKQGLSSLKCKNKQQATSLPGLISPHHYQKGNQIAHITKRKQQNNYMNISEDASIKPIHMYPRKFVPEYISSTEPTQNNNTNSNTNSFVFLRPEQNLPENFSQEKFRPIMPATPLGSQKRNLGQCESPNNSVSSDDIVVTLRSVNV